MPPPTNHLSTLSGGLDLAAREEQARWFASEVLPHELALRHWLRSRFPWLLGGIDDLVQECYVRILRAKSAGKAGHIRSLLFTTARNAAYDQARRHRVVSFENVADMATLSVLEDGPNAADTLTQNEELEILAAAIEALPKRCRLVVKLRKLRGLSYDEIAQQLGISVNTVNAQLVKGMIQCRAFLQSHGVDHDER